MPYTKLAARYVPTSHAQASTARPEVTKRVEPRTKAAMPVQKSVKSRAEMTASEIVPRTKEANRRTGSREKSVWATRKDCRVSGEKKCQSSSAVHNTQD